MLLCRNKQFVSPEFVDGFVNEFESKAFIVTCSIAFSPVHLCTLWR